MISARTTPGSGSTASAGCRRWRGRPTRPPAGWRSPATTRTTARSSASSASARSPTAPCGHSWPWPAGPGRVTLVRLPESVGFRGWYSLAARAAVGDYLTRFCGDQGVPLIDAQDWVSDDLVPDGFHLSAEGASRFTERLWAVALEGRP